MLHSTLTAPTTAASLFPAGLNRAALLERLASSEHQGAVLIRQMVERSVLHAPFVLEAYARALEIIEHHALITMPVGAGLAAILMDREGGWMFTLHLASSGLELNRHPVAALPQALLQLQPVPVGRGYLEYVPMPVREAMVGLLNGHLPVADYAFGGSQVRLAAQPATAHEVLAPLREWMTTHAWARRCERSDAPWSREVGNDRLRFSSGDALVGLEVRDYFLDTSRRPALRLVRSWRHQGVHVHWHHFTGRSLTGPHFTDF